VTRSLTHFKDTGIVLRVDGFQPMSRWQYFTRRLVALNTPFVAYLTMGSFLPSFTAGERAVHDICKNVIGGFAAFQATVMYTLMASAMLGWTNTLSGMEILTLMVNNVLLGWGACSARESFFATHFGLGEVNNQHLQKHLLRYATFVSDDGELVPAVSLAGGIILRARATRAMGTTIVSIPQQRHARMLKEGTGARRFSAAPNPDDLGIDAGSDQAEEFLETITTKQNFADVDSKYNITNCGFVNVLPHVLSITRALLPQFFRVYSGLPVRNRASRQRARRAQKKSPLRPTALHPPLTQPHAGRLF
jgi:hypothetical protein